MIIFTVMNLFNKNNTDNYYDNFIQNIFLNNVLLEETEGFTYNQKMKIVKIVPYEVSR